MKKLYLIDTRNNELEKLKSGKTIIRHNQELFEKEYVVFTVTDREIVTFEVCDYVKFKDWKPGKDDILLQGNIEYNEHDLQRIKNENLLKKI